MLKIEQMSDYWIKASEIPDYLYCRQSWWLHQVEEVQSHNQPQLNRGTKHHQKHVSGVQWALYARPLAYALAALAAAIIFFTLLQL